MKNRKLKIAFITDFLAPYCSANSLIVYHLAEAVKKVADVDISIVGYNRIYGRDFDSVDYATVIPMRNITIMDKIRDNYDARILRLIHQLLSISTNRLYIQSKIRKIDYHVAAFENMIDQLDRSGFDCMIGFVTPEAILQAFSTTRMETPYISFMLDPFLPLWWIKDKVQAEEIERHSIEHAAAVFANNLLFEDYKNSYKLGDNLMHKIHAFDYPNIIEPKQQNQSIPAYFEKGFFHCVFAGRLYNNIRNPFYSIDLFRRLKNDNVKFHIFGDIGGDSKNWLNTSDLPQNVIYHGVISNDESLLVMQNADVLVNIGNSVLNLLPSKILTYISLGKPILNIIKSPECPTLRYMNEYPLGLNVQETEEVREEDVQRVKDFILSSKDKHIPFEEIREKYYTCTPEYVGKQLYDVICKVVKEKEERDNR